MTLMDLFLLFAYEWLQLGVMRGSSVEASKENLRRVYFGALLMNWRVWTVTQWLSFHYVPPQLRVLWGASLAVLDRSSLAMVSCASSSLTLLRSLGQVMRSRSGGTRTCRSRRTSSDPLTSVTRSHSVLSTCSIGSIYRVACFPS